MLNECDSRFEANSSSEGKEMYESLENAVEGKRIFTPSTEQPLCCQQTKLSYNPSANWELMEKFWLSVSDLVLWSVCSRPASGGNPTLSTVLKFVFYPGNTRIPVHSDTLTKCCWCWCSATLCNMIPIFGVEFRKGVTASRQKWSKGLKSAFVLNSLAFRMMSSSLPESTWRTLTVSKIFFEPISAACGPVQKEEVQDFNIPPSHLLW